MAETSSVVAVLSTTSCTQ